MRHLKLVAEQDNSALDVYKHFSGATGFRNMAVARCNVHKQVQCLSTDTKDKVTRCTIRKFVQCKEVCKLKTFSTLRSQDPGSKDFGGYVSDMTVYGCSESLCDGSYGAVACREIILTA